MEVIRDVIKQLGGQVHEMHDGGDGGEDPLEWREGMTVQGDDVESRRVVNQQISHR